MTTKRPRNFDNQKLFSIYHNHEEFKQLQVNDGLLQVEETQNSVKRIEPIITPKVWRVQNVNMNQVSVTLPSGEVIEKKRKYNCGYIRVRREQFLPNGDAYELNDADYDYLKEYNQKNNCQVLQPALEKLISELELKSGRESTIELNDAVNLIYNKELHSQMSQKSFEEFYKYWRTRRERLQRSLLRQFWRATNDEQNQNIPFRPREKEKMKTRRANRPNDQDTLKRLKELQKEFNKSQLLFQEIKVREKIKLDILDAQILKFAMELYRVDKNAQFKLFGIQQVENQKELEGHIATYTQNLKESKELLSSSNKQHLKIMNKAKPTPAAVTSNPPETSVDNASTVVINPPVTTTTPVTENTTKPPVVVDTSQPTPGVSNVTAVKAEPQQETAQVTPTTEVKPKKPTPKVQETDDTTFDLTAFLASVLIEASNQGITFDQVFDPTKLPVETVVTLPQPEETIQTKPLVKPEVPRTNTVPAEVDTLPVSTQQRNKAIYFGIRKRIIRNGLIVIDRVFSEDVFKPDPAEDKLLLYAKDSMFENTYMRDKLDRFAKYVYNEDEEDNEDETKQLKKNMKLAIQEYNKKRQKKLQLAN